MGCYFILQGNLPNPEIEPTSPALAGRFLTTEPPGKRPLVGSGADWKLPCSTPALLTIIPYCPAAGSFRFFRRSFAQLYYRLLFHHSSDVFHSQGIYWTQWNLRFEMQKEVCIQKTWWISWVIENQKVTISQWQYVGNCSVISGFDPWVGNIPWRRAWQPTPGFLPGESPGIEGPGGLQSMGLQRTRHNWTTKHNTAQQTK